MARLNKQSLVDQLYLHDALGDVSKRSIVDIVDTIFNTIEDAVVNDDEVAIAGFGKFERYTRQNGVNKPKFTAFTDFKNAVSNV